MNHGIALRRTKEKRARYTSHLRFLSTCIRDSRIPKGFRIGWRAGIDMDRSISDKCENIKKDASLKLIELTRTACMPKISNLTDEILGQELETETCVIHSTDKWEEKELARRSAVKSGKLKAIEKDFTEVRVAGDGNCFYRCLSYYLHSTENYHNDIRKTVNSFLADNRLKFEPFIDGNIDSHVYEQTFADGRITSWATEAEVLAASAFYGINIKVKRKQGETFSWHTHSFGVSGDAEKHGQLMYDTTMHLVYRSHHYNLMLKEIYRDTRETGAQPINNHDARGTHFDWFDMTPAAVTNEPVHVPDLTKDVSFCPTEANCDESVKTFTCIENLNQPQRGSTIHSDDSVLVDHQLRPTVKVRTSEVDTVINMSSYNLNKAEVSLLSKGLKFIPDRSKIDTIKLLADLGEWERRMRLREFFHDMDREGDDANGEEAPGQRFTLKKKSHFTPNKGRDGWLDMYIELVKNDIIGNLRKCGKLNISGDEHAAFYSLLKNDNIIIRPADKGSGVVVVDKIEYIDRLHQEMVNSKSYCEEEADLTKIAMQRVKKLVNKMYKEKTITRDLQQYLIPRYPAPGKLKGNPKLHKEGAPFRTIVSGVNTPTERMAEVAEYELNEFVIGSPTYIRDTTDFIVKLAEVPTPIPKDAILFAFDVTKLYPSVPRREGLEACQEALSCRTNPLLPSKDVLKMIETVLDFNGFSLGDRHYRQTDGIAIGSRLGRNFACAYMRKWDEKLLNFNTRPYFYKRYIDDGFGIWVGDVASLMEFTEYANSINENINIELRWSKEKIEFLDTWVILKDGEVYTDLYVKPTDKQMYLQQSSCHPAHTKRALAYGLGLRLKRICAKEKNYKRHRAALKTQLRRRGYSGKCIEQQLCRVDKIDRHEALKPRERGQNNERVPLVLTFSKCLPDVRSILRKHEVTLFKSERMRRVFSAPPLLAFRRDKNICDVLVHSKTNRALDKPKDDCTCATCGMIWKSDVADTTNTKHFSTCQDVDCTTRNVVYALLCERCSLTIYVGETERTVKERTDEHRRDIRQQADRPIIRHFKDHCEGDLRVAILKKLYGDSRGYRQLWEDRWIGLLRSRLPDGCNVKYNVRR